MSNDEKGFENKAFGVPGIDGGGFCTPPPDTEKEKPKAADPAPKKEPEKKD